MRRFFEQKIKYIREQKMHPAAIAAVVAAGGAVVGAGVTLFLLSAGPQRAPVGGELPAALLESNETERVSGTPETRSGTPGALTISASGVGLLDVGGAASRQIESAGGGVEAEKEADAGAALSRETVLQLSQASSPRQSSWRAERQDEERSATAVQEAEGGIPPLGVQARDPDSPVDISVKTVSKYGAPLLSGNWMHFSAAVSNSGEGNIAVETFTDLRIDRGNDGTFDIVLARRSLPLLKAGDTATHIWKNALLLAPGEFRIEACVDAEMEIAEYDESNNCARVTFTVEERKIYPDIVVDSVTVRPSSACGDPCRTAAEGDILGFSAVISNDGEAPAKEFVTVLSIDKGNDKTIDADAERLLSRLLPSGVSEKKIWESGWTAEEGIHRFEACADAGLTVEESSEDNNCASVLVRVDPRPAASAIEFVVQDGAIKTDTLAVTPGGSVTFTNLDEAAYLFSSSAFAPVLVAGMASETIAAPQPFGKYEFYDGYASGVEGVIIVRE